MNISLLNISTACAPFVAQPSVSANSPLTVLKPRPGNIPDNRTDHSVIHFTLLFYTTNIILKKLPINRFYNSEYGKVRAALLRNAIFDKF